MLILLTLCAIKKQTMTNYNWKEILKNKSDFELISFFHNDLINDHEAKYLAISLTN